MKRCPRCDSPSPERHPAMQHEGEVQLCSHPYHDGASELLIDIEELEAEKPDTKELKPYRCMYSKTHTLQVEAETEYAKLDIRRWAEKHGWECELVRYTPGVWHYELTKTERGERRR